MEEETADNNIDNSDFNHISFMTMQVLDMLGYSFLLLFAVINVVKFLILEGRYRVLLLDMFYGLVMAVAVCRIIYFSRLFRE